MKTQKRRSTTIMDFFMFRRMLTPLLLHLVFWVCIVACIITGISDIRDGLIASGIAIIIMGSISIRIVIELLMLAFKIHRSLIIIASNSIKKK